MTKRGIDDLSFNGTVASNSGPASVMATSSKAEPEDSSNLTTSTTNIDPFTISNGTTDYLNGNSGGRNSSNGGSSFDDHLGNKKFKSDGSVPASAKSRVVHIRNIPAETSTSELMLIASPFGTVTKHLFVRSKGQAFVEFESHFSAMQMASYWIQTTIGGIPTQVQPTIRGRHVHVQVSNHKELKTHFENNNNGMSNISNSNLIGANGQLTMVDSYADGEVQHSSAGTSLTPSPVIRVLIENQIYAMTVDNLYQTFSRCGKVAKIVTFNKNQQFQALIQFSDIASAIQAKTNYDGQMTYGATPGFNTMRIEYSKLQNLIVKYNNEKSRDYTVANGNGSAHTSLNGCGGLSSSSSGHLANHHSVADPSTTADMSSTMLNQTLAAAAAGFPSTSFSPLTASAAAAMNLNGHHHPHNSAANFAAAAAFNPRSYLSAGAASIQQALSASAAALATGTLINPSNAAMFAAGIPTNLVFTSVVHVSGLNHEHVTPDALFTLFGVYGDVIRVKILFNKKDTALIQMAEPSQAQNAISYLDRTRLFGKTIHVMTSKHQIVQMPKEGHQDSGLTKDYTNSPLHRFKRPGSKNYNNIYPPSETLHVSNIPSSCSEEDLRQAFQQETGKDVVKFKFFPNDHRMALVQFDSIEDAISALIKMHNYKVAEHSHLRVSFSKSPV